jgi:hypothetical protein
MSTADDDLRRKQINTAQATLKWMLEVAYKDSDFDDPKGPRVQREPLKVISEISDTFNAALELIQENEPARVIDRTRVLKLLEEARHNLESGVPINGQTDDLIAAIRSLEPIQSKQTWQKKLRATVVNARSLEPLVDLPIDYIVNPLIVRGALTQVQGSPKGGKSAFSLYLSLCMTANQWPSPQYINSPLEKIRVLYIAWEDPEIMMAKRLALYAAGLGLQPKEFPENLLFMFAPDIFVDKEDHTQALMEAIAELKVDVVVIDTLSQVHLCDENEASEMKIPMANLRRIAKDTNIGIVYIHHTVKSGKDRSAQERGRGSGAIAAAWHICVDWGQRDKGSNINPVEVQSKYESEFKEWAVDYQKIKDDDKRLIGIKWVVDGLSEDTETNQTQKKGTTDIKLERILQTLGIMPTEGSEGWYTAREIADTSGLGLESKSIKRHLTELCTEGLILFKEGNGNPKKGPLAPNMYRLKPSK